MTWGNALVVHTKAITCDEGSQLDLRGPEPVQIQYMTGMKQKNVSRLKGYFGDGC